MVNSKLVRQRGISSQNRTSSYTTFAYVVAWISGHLQAILLNANLSLSESTVHKILCSLQTHVVDQTNHCATCPVITYRQRMPKASTSLVVLDLDRKLTFLVALRRNHIFRTRCPTTFVGSVENSMFINNSGCTYTGCGCKLYCYSRLIDNTQQTKTCGEEYMVVSWDIPPPCVSCVLNWWKTGSTQTSIPRRIKVGLCRRYSRTTFSFYIIFLCDVLTWISVYTP